MQLQWCKTEAEQVQKGLGLVADGREAGWGGVSPSSPDRDLGKTVPVAQARAY